jgi:hypothetical protein
LDLCGSEYRILAGACVDTIEPSVAIDLLLISYSDVTWSGFSKFVVMQITPVKTGVALVHERRKLRQNRAVASSRCSSTMVGSAVRLSAVT